MKIDVLGSGCAKCRALEERVHEALKKSGIKAEVRHITEIDKIISMGVFSTPALAVDGNVVISGSLPSVNEIIAILKGE